DIFIEYAKINTEDIAIRIEAINRGPDAAPLHILPHLWFRNTWAWSDKLGPEPSITPGPAHGFISLLSREAALETLTHVPVKYQLGPRILYGPAEAKLLFTGNETHMQRVFGPGAVGRRAHVKDAFHRQIVDDEESTNPANVGTKAAMHYVCSAIPPGASFVL